MKSLVLIKYLGSRSDFRSIFSLGRGSFINES